MSTCLGSIAMENHTIIFEPQLTDAEFYELCRHLGRGVNAPDAYPLDAIGPPTRPSPAAGRQSRPPRSPLSRV